MHMTRYFFVIILLLSAVCLAMVVAKTSSSKASAAIDITAPHRAVVVELFTSEGCSSCPPADELLGRLPKAFAAKNIQVIPLGFHVDYWNSLGWKDRFSSAEFTHRQEQYERNLKVDGAYTPQMVVNGESEFVGSISGEAQRSISHAAVQPELAAIKVSKSGPDQLAVEISAAGTVSGNVMLAITEDNLATHVGSGENSGHTLHHTAVVRELRRLGRLKDGAFKADAHLQPEADWKRADLRAVVFVQAENGGKILGAASVSLAGQLR